MKKLFTITALSLILTSTNVFASCCHKTYIPYSNCCEPVTQITYVEYEPPCCIQKNPCCNTCETTEKKSFFTKVFDGTKNLYNSSIGSFFNSGF